MISLFIFIFFACSSGPVNSQKLIFAKDGQGLRRFPQQELLQNLKPQILASFEPELQKIVTYKGFSTLDLLKLAYPPATFQNPKDLQVVFYCQDGYRADVSYEEFLNKKSLLAFSFEKDKPFVMTTQGQKKMDLGPYYLVWDHPNENATKKTTFKWPYQIVKIDLVEKKKISQALAPSANPAAVRGATVFLNHCFSCHQLNGHGGQKGPPLDPLISLLNDKTLDQIILNPRAVSATSSMTGLPSTIKDRQKMADDLIVYLRDKIKKNIKR